MHQLSFPELVASLEHWRSNTNRKAAYHMKPFSLRATLCTQRSWKLYKRMDLFGPTQQLTPFSPKPLGNNSRIAGLQLDRVAIGYSRF